MKMKFTIREIVLIAILGALAAVLHFFRFPLPFMPPFMDFDFAAIPEIIGSFILGPIPGVFIVLIKCLVKIIMTGSNTMYVGDLSNFIVDCALIIPAAIIYKRNKTRKSAIVGLSVGVISMCVIATLSNVLFIIPFYAKMYGIPVAGIVEMATKVNPWIKDLPSLVIFGILPFNIIKGAASSIVTVLIYKRISVLFKKA